MEKAKKVTKFIPQLELAFYMGNLNIKNPKMLQAR